MKFTSFFVLIFICFLCVVSKKKSSKSGNTDKKSWFNSSVNLNFDWEFIFWLCVIAFVVFLIAICCFCLVSNFRENGRSPVYQLRNLIPKRWRQQWQQSRRQQSNEQQSKRNNVESCKNTSQSEAKMSENE